MKLYDAKTPGTRATRVRWMLEELGVPHERVILELQKGDMRTPEHLGRHPHGKVPALEIDGQTIVESAAMCMHACDLHPERGLAPAVGTAERALWYQWIVYAISTLDEALVPRIFHTMLLPEDRRDPAVVAKADATWEVAAPFLSRGLEGREWLVGESFGAADVVVGYDVVLAQRQGLLEGHPTLAAYYARLAARPAFQTAYGG